MNLIHDELLLELRKYLGKQPYDDVAMLIAKLTNLQKLEIQKSEKEETK